MNSRARESRAYINDVHNGLNAKTAVSPAAHYRCTVPYPTCNRPALMRPQANRCFSRTDQDETSKSSSAANELGLANVGGVFVVLMGGMGVACVIAVCEFVWKSRKVAIEERVSDAK